MRRTSYNLVAGTFTPIPALQFARRVELTEDAAAAAVGLSVKYPEDNFVGIHDYLPAQEPVIIGNTVAFGHGQGPILGWPVQTGLNARAADTYCTVSCLSGTTKLWVTEID